MEYSFLDRCFQAIRPATWKRINELLGLRAREEERIKPAVIRTDTTAAETNIHWPTDSSLLWDVWRVASRVLKRGRKIARATCPHRFHDRKIKRLHLFITRYSKSTSKIGTCLPRERSVEDLAHSLRVITVVFEVFGQRNGTGHPLAEVDTVAPDAARVRPQARQETGPRRPANRLLAIGPQKHHPPRRQRIDVGTCDVIRAVTAQLGPQIVDGNEQNVGPYLLFGLRRHGR